MRPRNSDDDTDPGQVPIGRRFREMMSNSDGVPSEAGIGGNVADCYDYCFTA